MAVKKVQVGIEVDKRGATRGYKQFSDSVASQNKKIRSELEKTKSASAGLGVGIKGLVAAAGGLFIFSKVNSLIRESISLAGEQASAEAKVEQTIRATGQAAGITADEMKKMASEFQNVTTFGDEVILRGQSMLLTFKQIGKDVFPAATEAMLNLSVAMGTDVKESAIQLGKALNDPITGLTALRRVGITFSKEQENIIKNFQKTGDIASAQKLILQELESQFGGLAKAVALTGEGPLIQFQNIVGDVKEDLGDELLPVLIDVTKGFKEFLLEGKESGKIQDTFKAIALSAQLMFSIVSDSFRGLRALFNIAAAAIADRMAGIFGAVEGVLKFESKLDAFFGGTGGKYNDLLKGMTSTMEGLRKASEDTSDELFEKGLFSVDSGSAIERTFSKISEGAKEAKKEIAAVRGAAGIGDVEGGDAGSGKANKALEKQMKDAQEFELMQLQGAAKMREESRKAESDRLVEQNNLERAIFEQKVSDREKQAAKELAIEKEKNRAIIASDRAVINQKITIAKQAAGLAGEIFGEGKAVFLFQQSLAAGEVIINTMRGIAAAIAEPFGVGIPRIPLIKATGGIALATILAQSVKGFQSGGFLGDGPATGDRTLFRGNKNEVVLNPAQQKNFMALANGRGNSGGMQISFGDTIINSSSGNPGEIANAVNETMEEKIRMLQDVLNEKDALLVT